MGRQGDLVKPMEVIPSHVNDVGTVGGKVRPGSKTEAFVKAVKVSVRIPLSGKTMEFGAAKKCTGGVDRQDAGWRGRLELTAFGQPRPGTSDPGRGPASDEPALLK